MKNLILLVLLTLPAAAEWTPPGEYFDDGLVVRRANGAYDLFDGDWCMLQLTDALAIRLEPFADRIVRVHYVRVKYDHNKGHIWDNAGSVIAEIKKIEILPVQPLRVTVTAPGSPFTMAKPVTLAVAIQNLSSKPVPIPPEVAASLLRDFHSKRFVHAERKKTTLAANQTLRFQIRFDRPAYPGDYDAIVVLEPLEDRPILSNRVQVTVRPPSNKEETAALQAWLRRTEPHERIRIAERLIERGDRCGVEVVLELVPEGASLQSPVHLYSFVWKHGGEKGEQELFRLLGRMNAQTDAWRIIVAVFRSPQAIAHLEKWLADTRAVRRDIRGWCENPRICDIIANRVCFHYTNKQMEFPINGSKSERDVAVAAVLAKLKENPAYFSILRRKH